MSLKSSQTAWAASRTECLRARLRPRWAPAAASGCREAPPESPADGGLAVPAARQPGPLGAGRVRPAGAPASRGLQGVEREQAVVGGRGEVELLAGAVVVARAAQP